MAHYLCALQVYVAGFGPDDISSAAVWFGPDQELLDTSVSSFRALYLER